MLYHVCRVTALLLISAVFMGAFSACTKKSKPLMTLGEQEISVNMYELLLSRMKGTLAYNDYPVEDERFWDSIISAQGATYNDYFCSSIQSEAKKMLCKLYLFEEVYHLTLPQESYDKVDQWMEDTVSLDFDGSYSAWNRVLSSYGINADMLRENYLMEEKVDHLLSHVSSITGEMAVEEYYQNNYVCFRQILFPLYAYVYETDENGDEIYYHEDITHIYYDLNGTTRSDAEGNFILDKNGDVVHYTEDGRIAYNSEKGIRNGIDKDEDGYVDYEKLDEQATQIVTDRANHVKNLISSGDFTMFESYGAQWSEDDVWNSYPNGIFLNLEQTYSLNYLDEIQSALAGMQVGEIALISSENAYHLIMKYELLPQAYQNKDNADWFESLDEEVAAYIVEQMCQKYSSDVIINDSILTSAMDMKTIGANIEY